MFISKHIQVLLIGVAVLSSGVTAVPLQAVGKKAATAAPAAKPSTGLGGKTNVATAGLGGKKVTSPVPTSAKDVEPHISKEKLHDKALFYSAGEKGKSLEGLASTVSHAHQLTALLLCFESDKYVNDNKGTQGFWGMASEAMAHVAAGKVYVLLPTGATPATWHKESLWAKYEWPVLCKNAGVTEIVQLDAGKTPVDMAGVGDLKLQCPK